MKKLCLFVCFCLILSSVAACGIPASALMVTEIPNAADVPAPKEKTKLIYSEDFDGDALDSSLTGSDLIRALGWYGSLGADDSLSLVSEGENRAVSITANTTCLDTVCLLRNDALCGGDYILEYTVHLVSNSKTDPERTFGFCSESATTFDTNTNTAWRFAMKEDGTADHHLKINANKVVDGGTSLSVAANDGVSASLVGSTYRVRIVVDADFGVSAYLLNGEEATLISATDSATSALWQTYSGSIGNELRFHILSGITATFDDIQVWTCKYIDASVPQYLGYQVSSPCVENTFHDIRFIAGVQDLSASSIGMEITCHYTLINGDPTTDKVTLRADTVYESIETDFGASAYSASEEFPYLMALELSDIPTRMTVVYEIQPFAVYQKEDGPVTVYGPTHTLTLDRGITAAIPVFPGQNIATTTIFDTNYFRQFYSGTDLSLYEQYLSDLTAKGYTQYARHTLDGNVYTTLYNDHLVIHAYYMEYTDVTTVLTTYKSAWVPFRTEAYGDITVATPSLALMNMNYGYNATANTYGHNNGMGFVYTLADGSYVIIDGGYAAEAEPLYNYLVENNKRLDGKVLIRAWIMTHPDGDHIGCFIKFATKYSKLVTLEYFVAQADISHEGAWATTKSCVSDFAGCQYLVPLAGQSMYFGTLRLEFFFTAEMFRCYGAPGTNESSLAFKGYLGGTSVFFAGDIVGRSIDVVANRYSASLKSDVLQLPHHGLNGSYAFYRDILPSTVFYCTHAQAADQRWTKLKYNGQSAISSLKNMNCVKNVYIADGGIQVFTMSQLASTTE